MGKVGLTMADRQPGTTLKVFAVLFGILAISNLGKGLRIGAETGFVFLGERLTGTPNAVLGAIFGLYLLLYAYGIWNLRKWALPMGIAYLAYVVINLVLFSVRGPKPPPGIGYVLFGLTYMAVAIGVAGGAVYLLKNEELR
jgi:hypothetical protein